MSYPWSPAEPSREELAIDRLTPAAAGQVLPSERVFRPELQGLRALAVALVVVHHVWLNRVSGGVDVFFLLSGFLLTDQLTRAAERGPLDLPRRWSRMIVRLVPTSVVVLVGTAAAAAVVLPESRWPQILREVLAAGLFVENWQLAADSVDYAARNNVASVVQHYWSLSIQAQFFLLWPLVVAAVALSARHSVAVLRARLSLVTAGLFVTSLAFSIELTATNQPLAYFHSLTRLWEFALGGLLALHLHLVRLSRAMRVLLGWVGVAGLLVCGLVFQVGDEFPGVAALWPTGCAALVLIAGRTGHPGAVDRCLASGPLRQLGDLSFTLYLWHWPVLVLALVAGGHETLGLVAGAEVIGLSLLLAVLTRHLVEKPALSLRAGTLDGYRLGVVGVIVVLIVVAGWHATSLQRSEVDGVVGQDLHPGAIALLTGPVESAPVLPPPAEVYEDWVRIERWDCRPLTRFPMDACTQQRDTEPTRRIVVVGDSHMQQLSGALIPIADARGWQLTVIVRGACPFSTASEIVPDDVDCLSWNEAAAAEIAELHPDAVVTLASRDVRVGRSEQTPTGFVDRWRQLDELGIPVLALRDNPRFDSSMPDCVQQRRADGAPDTDAQACGAPRVELYAAEPPWSQVPDLPPNVSFLDLADLLCTPTFCPAEIGNVLVYLDDNHVSATYSTSMSALLTDAAVAALDGPP